VNGDVEKLAKIANAASDIEIKHERYRGPAAKTEPMRLHRNAVFTWAAIASREPDDTAFTDAPAEFLPLMAVTSTDKPAEAVKLRVRPK